MPMPKERTFIADGKVLSYNDFEKAVTESLEKYNYADVTFMSTVLKSPKEGIRQIYDQKIIDYVRTNEGTTIKPLCNETHIKSRYVFDLINSERLDAKVAHNENELLELRQEEEEAEKINQKNYEEEKRLNNLKKMQELQGLFDQQEKTVEEDKPKYRFIGR